MSWGYEEELQKWTDKDLQEFAEWCSYNGWKHATQTTAEGKLINEWWYNENSSETKTTSQLQFDWEVETGRRKK